MIMMTPNGFNSYTVAQARDAYLNNSIKAIRLDHVLGSFYMFVKTYRGDLPIRTQRYEQKAYKSLAAVISDYEHITGKPFKSFELAL